ncbi:MAG: NAD(P)H-hydrate dehydratase [Planctomycetes bacterium]|nr:NAD(P)H-hydrate dehydratase [Planctomycetota bacterium]
MTARAGRGANVGPAWRLVRRLPPLPARPRDGHKGTFGTVLVVAGQPGMAGAAILAATAALRGGAGLVQAMVPRSLQPVLAVAVPCATSLVATVANARRAAALADAVVVGPGLGTEPGSRRVLAAVLAAASRPVVVDADALNLLAPLPQRGRVRTKAPLVLTPHPGEAARLLSVTTADVQRDRAAALRELCRRSGAVVVLKGAGTLVGDGARWFQNRTGNPGLGTGGSGDVLAGLLGALLAQGLAPFDAACLAVHVHGAAGDRVARRIGERGLIASDLPLAIAEELR